MGLVCMIVRMRGAAGLEGGAVVAFSLSFRMLVLVWISVDIFNN